jgi:methionyl-tRNA formyltransferase
MKIIFFGTPGFAVVSLKALHESEHEISAVVTAPDRASGRGLKIKSSEVKQFAEKEKLNILQPEKLKNKAFIDQIRSYQADVFIVVAFRMLPEIIWQMPPMGCINLHASLLPNYRGAAPINWAIINGENKTGVTSFFINEEIDTGDYLLKKEIAISFHDTAGSLHDKLAIEGAHLLLETLNKLESGDLNAQQQILLGEEKAAPKLNRSVCRIDWKKDIQDVYNQIRGLSPYPAAWTMLDNKVCKVYQADFIEENHDNDFGNIDIHQKNSIQVACKNGYILVKELQLEGKKQMTATEFLNGYSLSAKSKMH